MSLKTLPILFLNMGGEMVYILDQRLQAQAVKRDKASRVLGDIVGTIFSKKFLEELFKPQELYTRRSMRTLFDKLAHASIMRLNTTSMDKLYDLMTMAIKYQLMNCSSPKDILLMTMNHMDGMRKLVQGTGNVQSQIDYGYELFSTTFFNLTDMELQLVRTTLLSFYQDARIKVSLLLREKKQKEDGRFVIPIKGLKLPYNATVPGPIKYYHKGKISKTDSFNSGGSYTEVVREGSLAKTAKTGDRVTHLGLNIYRNSGVDIQGGFGSSYTESSSGKGMNAAAMEISFLSRLLGPSSSDGKRIGPSPVPDFSLSLFESVEDEQNFKEQAKLAEEHEANVIRIDASKNRHNAHMDRLMNDLSLDDNGSKGMRRQRKERGEDMLELMDNAY